MNERISICGGSQGRVMVVAVVVAAALLPHGAPAGSAPPLCKGKVATIAGTPGDDHLVGTEDRDVIAGRAGDDLIEGFGGNDLICGGPGADRIDGGEGNDHIRGGSGRNHISGGLGHDKLYGGRRGDLLDGRRGNDYLNGGDGADKLFGRRGKDYLAGGYGSEYKGHNAGDGRPDYLDGGAHEDTCEANGADETKNCERFVVE